MLPQASSTHQSLIECSSRTTNKTERIEDGDDWRRFLHHYHNTETVEEHVHFFTSRVFVELMDPPNIWYRKKVSVSKIFGTRKSIGIV